MLIITTEKPVSPEPCVTGLSVILSFLEHDYLVGDIANQRYLPQRLISRNELRHSLGQAVVSHEGEIRNQLRQSRAVLHALGEFRLAPLDGFLPESLCYRGVHDLHQHLRFPEPR